jgi:putative glycosyltransferase (TIGR04372 family)
MKLISIFFKLPLYALAVPVVLGLRLIRPWFLVRWGRLNSSRIGHFAANTELYFCEKDAGINVPRQRYADLFCMEHGPISNLQLALMWKRTLRVWPVWLLFPIIRVNQLIPGGSVHEIGNNTKSDRDVHNLMDRFPPHLGFTPEEETRGEAGLRVMGIPQGARFVCLIVRDSTYLDDHQPSNDWNYHNYRDSDIQNYIMAAEKLADRGYFVIRMGTKVDKRMETLHPRVFDNADNSTRSDFMDVYLGAKCAFCISVGTGFDAIPHIFHRPIVYVNAVPLGYLATYMTKSLNIIKQHCTVSENRVLTLREIFNYGVGFCLRTSDYMSKGVKLIENTPKEIHDVVIEMEERLSGAWQPYENDEGLQERFWEIFLACLDTDSVRYLHGGIRSRFGTHFLRNNLDWLQ